MMISNDERLKLEKDKMLEKRSYKDLRGDDIKKLKELLRERIDIRIEDVDADEFNKLGEFIMGDISLRHIDAITEYCQCSKSYTVYFFSRPKIIPPSTDPLWSAQEFDLKNDCLAT